MWSFHSAVYRVWTAPIPGQNCADRSGKARRARPAGLYRGFRGLGFRAVSVLRDFYDDTTEDAYLMQYRWKPVPQEIIIPTNRITKLAG